MKPLIVLSFLSVFISSSLFAQQDTYPCLAMEVQSIPLSNYLMPDSSVSYSESTVFSLQMLISLFDTAGINNVQVKIGRTLHGSDVVNDSYNFNTYRTGYNIALALGSYSNLLHYYAEIKLERTNETLTDIVSFSR